MTEEVLKKVEEVIQPILERLGYELVDLELVVEGAQILRIYIDQEGGVTIADCELASRTISDSLDAEDFIPFKYRLELSSPGLDRPLKTFQDFQRFKGNMVKIKTQEPIEGRSNYKGKLTDVNEDQVSVAIDGKDYQIPVGLIAKARLVPDFLELKGKQKRTAKH